MGEFRGSRFSESVCLEWVKSSEWLKLLFFMLGELIVDHVEPSKYDLFESEVREDAQAAQDAPKRANLPEGNCFPDHSVYIMYIYIYNRHVQS